MEGVNFYLCLFTQFEFVDLRGSIVLSRIKLITNHCYLGLIACSGEVINYCQRVSLYLQVIRMKEHPPDKPAGPHTIVGHFLVVGLISKSFLLDQIRPFTLIRRGVEIWGLTLDIPAGIPL